MNYGGLRAEVLFVAGDSSHENKPKKQNVKRLHTTEAKQPVREERGLMRSHVAAHRR